MCKLVADTYQCEEVSVFLDARRPHEYIPVASTWTKGTITSSYSPGDDGLTGWIISHRQPVQIFVLLHCERDIEAIRRKYPGIVWKDSLKLRARVRHLFDLGPEDQPPPIAFMGAPILLSETLLGAIRCSITTKAPYYFGDREVKLLELVAQQIGHYWAMTGRIYRAETARASLVKQQSVMFDDLTHQLKSPIIQAYSRAIALADAAAAQTGLRSALHRVRGLCGRGAL